jgi:hypothetical protein
VRAGDRSSLPGAVRASAGLNTTSDDIDRFQAAVAEIATNRPSPSPTARIPPPATTGSRATYPAGPAPSERWARRAPEADRPRQGTRSPRRRMHELDLTGRQGRLCPEQRSGGVRRPLQSLPGAVQAVLTFAMK